jgi:hypothetical protein
MMSPMTGRVVVWGGGLLALAAPAGLGVYLNRVGLDEADKLSSVIGGFVGLLGLGLAAYGIVLSRRTAQAGDRPPRPSGERSVQITGTASGQGQVNQAGRDAYQAGRDQHFGDR